MINIKKTEQSFELYNKIKQIILENENSIYNWQYSEHTKNLDLPEEIRKKFIYEEGEITYTNIDGNIVTLKISRGHLYKRWSRYHIYEIPNYEANIYINNKLVWSLISNVKDSSEGEYSDTYVTCLDIPMSLIQEKHFKLINDNTGQIPIEEKELTLKENTSQETRNIFNEIDKLYEKQQKLIKEKEKLEKNKEIDIDKAIKTVTKSYTKKLSSNKKNINDLRENIDDFNKLLIKYSTFNIDQIGNILKQLISIIENEEYLYKKIKYTSQKRVHGVIDSWNEKYTSNLYLIIKKNESNNNCSILNKDTLDKLIAKKNALLLLEQDENIKNNNSISFYSLAENNLKCNINFESFNLVKDFITNLIQYRFQNRIDKINEKDLLTFLQNYIIEHKDLIIKNYEVKFDSIILKLTK